MYATLLHQSATNCSQDFAEVHCAVADHSHQPSAYMVQHTVPVIVLTPQARLYFYYNT